MTLLNARSEFVADDVDSVIRNQVIGKKNGKCISCNLQRVADIHSFGIAIPSAASALVRVTGHGAVTNYDQPHFLGHYRPVRLFCSRILTSAFLNLFKTTTL